MPFYLRSSLSKLSIAIVLPLLLSSCALNTVSKLSADGIKPLEVETLRSKMAGNTTYFTDPTGRDYPLFVRTDGTFTIRLSTRNHVGTWRADGSEVCMDGMLGGKNTCLQIYPVSGGYIGCLDSHHGKCMVKVRFANGNPENLPLVSDSIDPRFAESAAAARPIMKPEGSKLYPLVVLIHGCSGIGLNSQLWQEFFYKNGYATLVVDSFSPRGVSEICSNFTRVLYGERVADVYAALRRAAAEPGIDPKRISVMGFSHGAGVVLDAVGDRVVNSLPAAQPRPYTAIAVYPECSNRQSARVGVPTLIAIGEADDWTPAKDCESLVAKHPKEAPQLMIKTYPNAYHAFDIPGLSTTFRGDVMNPNSKSGFGATVGGNPTALGHAQEDVLRFLETKF
jgi:dienelactone hydrolase